MLVTALVGPFFVDWTLYRSTFETYAERVLGHRVTVLGEADMRLLPSPSVTFSDVRVGEAEDPLLVVSRFQMRVELPPLMKGEIKILDLRLDRPHLQLSLDEGGRLDWLTAMSDNGILSRLDSEDVTFENVQIIDGLFSVVDARSGETLRLTDGNLSVSARTLAGPYRIDGSLSHDSEPYSVRVATGRQQADGAIRIKGQITPTRTAVDLSIDGLLAHDDAVPRLEGTFGLASIAVDGNEDHVWDASGDFALDISRLDIPAFEYRFGPEERRLSADGTAELIYAGNKRFEVRARSKQLDLDRLLGGGPQAPIALNTASERLFAALRSLPMPDIDGAISLDVPTVVVGGGIAQDVRLDLETMLGGWRVARFAGRAPGRTVIATQGDLGLEPDVTYRGNLSVTSEQPGAFASWWRQTGKGATTLQPIGMEGRLNIVPGGVALDNLRVSLADAEGTGSLAYRIRRSDNPIFSLSLSADRLDLDEIMELSEVVRSSELRLRGVDEPSGPLADLDVSIRVQADEVQIGGVSGQSLALEAEYADGDLRIERLFTADLAGSQIDVSGAVNNLLSTPQGRLAGSLVAEDLGGLVNLAKGAFPESGLVDRFEQAAPFLVPARFAADVNATAADGGSAVSVSMNGEAGGAVTAFTGRLNGRVDQWHEADLDLVLELEGPEGGALLRQLGFEVLPAADLGAGSIAITAMGRPSDGLELTLDATAPAAELGVNGNVRLRPERPALYELNVVAATPDLSPLALMAGRVLPVMAGDIPADVIFTLRGDGSKVNVDGLQGTVADITLDGALAGNLDPLVGETNRRFSGDLRLSGIDLRYLSEAILGPDQWSSAGDGSSMWPSAAFGAPLLSGTDLTVQIEADELRFDDSLQISGVTTELRLTPMMLRLDGLSGTYANGAVQGALAIRRSGAEGAVSGRIKLENADVRRLIWTRDGRAVATGNLDLFLELDGAGRSISAIVAGLNGGGTFSVTDGDLRGLNPQAFDLVVRAVDAGLELEDARIEEAFLSHMQAGQLAFESLEGSVGLVGGRISARNVVVDAQSAEVFGSAEADLNTLTIDSDFTIRVDPGDDAVTGADPQVGLLFQGPVDGPERRIDIAPFTAYLTLRAFEQEVERVERLQAEILERDRLSRELRRLQEERTRRERSAEELEAEEGAESQDNPQEEASLTGDSGSAASDSGANGAVTAAQPALDAPQQANVTDSPSDDAASAQVPPAASSDFSARIRAVIDTRADSDTIAPADLSGLATESIAGTGGSTGALPPLGAPQTIEDLLGGQTILVNPGFDFGVPADTVARDPAPTSVRQTRPIRTEPPATPSVPRYRTLPNGVVVENPDWRAN